MYRDILFGKTSVPLYEERDRNTKNKENKMITMSGKAVIKREKS